MIKKNAKLFLALVFTVPLLIGTVIFNFNKLDPLKRTNTFFEAKIIDIKIMSPRSSGGHSGGAYTPPFYNNSSSYKIIRVRSKNGNEYSFIDPLSCVCTLNTIVGVRQYKRNITKLTKYKLEKRNWGWAELIIA